MGGDKLSKNHWRIDSTCHSYHIPLTPSEQWLLNPWLMIAGDYTTLYILGIPIDTNQYISMKCESPISQGIMGKYYLI